MMLRTNRARYSRIGVLVAHLIKADGDPDLEPSLGWSKTFMQGSLDIDALRCDLEGALDDKVPDADDESWTAPLS